MICKAILMKDPEGLISIAESETPAEAKREGRLVGGF